VDAAYKAIDSLVRVDTELLDYSVSSVTEGINALATTRCAAGRRLTGGWPAADRRLTRG
jgi:2-isopropylmalate synthase